MAIKDLLKLLPPNKRQQLMCAFEEGVETFVELDTGDEFLGVNISFTKGLDILEQAGAFSYGKIKKDG